MGSIGFRDLVVEVIVGILPRERVTPQRVVASVWAEVDVPGVGETGDLAAGLDYAELRDITAFVLREGRFRLLESIAVVLGTWWRLPPGPGEGRARAGRVGVVLQKPDILGGGTVAEVRWEAQGPASDLALSLPEVEVTRRILWPGEPWTGPGVAFQVGVGSVERAVGPATILVIRRK